MNTIKTLKFDECTQPLGHKVGSLNGVTYSELLDALGQPTWDEASGDDKVQKEWVVKFNSQQFTIYDWKTYDEEYTTTLLKTWSIGGTEDPYGFKLHLLELLGRI